MSGPTGPEDEGAFAAAEYALGLLATPERRLAESRLRRDEAFRREVGAWEERLAPLLAGVAPVAPGADVWEGIEGELPSPRAPAGLRPAAAGLVPAFWRRAALGSGLLAAASLAGVALLLWSPTLPAPVAPALMAATITAGDGGMPLFTVVVDREGGAATLVPVRMDVGAGSVPELWLIASEGAAPVSLGVVNPAAPLRVRWAPEDPVGGAAPVLAISLEPAGGSPTGRPTGPVVGTGALHSV